MPYCWQLGHMPKYWIVEWPQSLHTCSRRLRVALVCTKRLAVSPGCKHDNGCTSLGWLGQQEFGPLTCSRKCSLSVGEGTKATTLILACTKSCIFRVRCDLGANSVCGKHGVLHGVLVYLD